ncbi:hypothetical protein AVEN_247561-1 [Araneus ventricosus]|uniref:Uncharacterized protein n=1 Tax=Araneus ventricosus TaxID=182803 RepID=A0A4Y2D9L2_ARAVE|nr:hypothetical protein AVEN_247561-1 [Araneus ventricosus]
MNFLCSFFSAFRNAGAKVIIGCRDTEKGKKAAEDIRKQVQNARVIIKELDLASFSSIRKFAAEILKSEPRIHILINNAGNIAITNVCS